MKKEKFITKLIKKRIRKKVATSEFYKAEMPEHFSSAIEASKETVILSSILIIILTELNLKIYPLFIIFFFSYLFWKICQNAMIGWSRLNRLHKVIKEEKFEIEHHREKERKELEMIYKAKGFSGKLLEDVIDVLMADDNRLLQVMMEEEMGLTLRRYEHPLKQGIFAAIGVFISSLLLAFPLLYRNSILEFFIFGSFLIILSSFFSYKRENLSFTIVWNLAILALISLITLFSIRFIKLL
jgi:VIT1/CCC1 family predicted Fe2+/Mn2+ transporter